MSDKPQPVSAGKTSPPSRELLTFAAIGGSALFVDLGVLWLALNGLGLGFYAARLISYLSAATYTWALNRHITFRHADRRGALRQWALFVAANGVGGSINYGVSAAVVTWGPALLSSMAPPGLLPLLPYLGTAAGSVSGLGFNFVMSKWLVFRRPASAAGS